MPVLKPFANESDAVSIGELNIENRVDQVSIFGSVDITRDKVGLEKARALKAIADSVLAALESEALPDQVEVKSAGDVPNPFNQN